MGFFRKLSIFKRLSSIELFRDYISKQFETLRDEMLCKEASIRSEIEFAQTQISESKVSEAETDEVILSLRIDIESIKSDLTTFHQLYDSNLDNLFSEIEGLRAEHRSRLEAAQIKFEKLVNEASEGMFAKVSSRERHLEQNLVHVGEKLTSTEKMLKTHRELFAAKLKEFESKLAERETRLIEREERYKIHLSGLSDQLKSSRDAMADSKELTTAKLKEFETKLAERETRLLEREEMYKKHLASLNNELNQSRESGKDLKELVAVKIKESDERIKTRESIIEENLLKYKEVLNSRDLSIKMLQELIDSKNKEFKSSFERYVGAIKEVQAKVNNPAISDLKNRDEFLFRTLFQVDPWMNKIKDSQRGKRCFLLGCGPSLSKVDLSLLKNEDVMSVNGAVLLKGLRSKYFITVAKEWWKQRGREVGKIDVERIFFAPYIGIEACKSPVTELNTVEYKDYQHIKADEPWFFSKEANRYVLLGGTVIFPALQILYWLGYETVVLLGVDHNYDLISAGESQRGVYVSGKSVDHFDEDYYKKDVQIHCDLKAMERSFKLSRSAFAEDGRQIINATLGTKLDIFEKARLEDLIS